MPRHRVETVLIAFVRLTSAERSGNKGKWVGSSTSSPLSMAKSIGKFSPPSCHARYVFFREESAIFRLRKACPLARSKPLLLLLWWWRVWCAHYYWVRRIQIAMCVCALCVLCSRLPCMRYSRVAKFHSDYTERTFIASGPSNWSTPTSLKLRPPTAGNVFFACFMH